MKKIIHWEGSNKIGEPISKAIEDLKLDMIDFDLTDDEFKVNRDGWWTDTDGDIIYYLFNVEFTEKGIAKIDKALEYPMTKEMKQKISKTVKELEPCAVFDNEGDFMYWSKKVNTKAHNEYLKLLKAEVITELGFNLLMFNCCEGGPDKFDDFLDRYLQLIKWDGNIENLPSAWSKS